MRTKLLVLALWLTSLPMLVQAAGTTWQNATLISAGGTQTGSLSNTNKEGWFKINVSEDGTAELTCKPANGLSLRYLSLYSLVGNEVKQRNNQWIGTDGCTLTVPDLKAGTYYVRVEFNSGQGNYTLVYNFSPTSKTHADDGEPNDNFSQAKPLPINGSTTGHLGYYYWDDRDNQDWFYIKVPEDGTAEFTCTPANGLSLRYLTLYSLADNQAQPRNNQWIGDNGCTLTVPNLKAGTYYVRVEYNSGQGGYALNYQFTPTSNTHADDVEPNDNFSQAKPLPINGSTTGHLGYDYWNNRDNIDWFYIKVPEDGTAEFTCTPAKGLGLRYLTLYSLVGNEVKQRNNQWIGDDGCTLTEPNLKAGTYYVRVEYNSGQGGYKLDYNFTPTSYTYADDGEPNQEFTDAKLLRRGHTITGHLGYYYWDDRDNQDWFKIVVPRDGITSLTCTPAKGLGLRYLTFYSLSAGALQSRKNQWIGAEGCTLTIPDTAPGTYYVRVEYNDGQGGYTLAYDFEQTPYATDKEPNNEQGQAISLDKGKTVSGHLGYFYWDDRDNNDWYEVKVASKGTVNFTCKPAEGLSLRYITLYQGNSNRGSLWMGTDGGTLTVKDVEAGTYQVRVEYGSGQGHYFLAYDTKIGNVTPQEPLPADEDNGVPTDPKPGTTWQNGEQIVGGQTVEGGMSEQVKDAWYKVVVAKDGTAHFNIRLDSKLDIEYMELCYLDAERKTQRRYNNYIDAYPNEQKTLTVNDLAPGTYYLHISRWSGDGKFTLTYRFEPNAYDNDKENNDTWQGAQQLARNKSVTGHLGYQYYNDPDETDWYKINVPRDGKVTLTLTQHDNLDIYYMSLNVLKADGTIGQRNYIDNGTNAENKIETADIAAGTYYVEVQRFSGPGAYTLNYRFEQNEYATDNEPNNEWTQAQTLIDGEPTSGHLGYYALDDDKDVDDWYAIDVPAKSTVELTIRLSKDVDIYYMRMHTIDGNTPKQYSGGEIDAYFGEEKILTLSNVEAGRYYVQVHHFAGAGHYLIGYNCKVDGVKPQEEPPVEPGDEPGGGSGNTTAAGYFFAWLNNGMYTAYPLAHRPQLTMSGTTFTLKTTQTSVTYAAKDVLKFTMSDINGNPLGIDEVFSGWVAPSILRDSDRLLVRGCVPGMTVAIYTVDGKPVCQQKADANGDTVIALGQLPRGVYIVKSGSATIKITRK